jgi:hypothetical protein
MGICLTLEQFLLFENTYSKDSSDHPSMVVLERAAVGITGTFS